MKANQTTRFDRSEEVNESVYAKFLPNAKRKKEISNNSGNVVIDSPGTIVGRSINVKTSRSSGKIQPAAGTVAAKLDASRYNSTPDQSTQ